MGKKSPNTYKTPVAKRKNILIGNRERFSFICPFSGKKEGNVRNIMYEVTKPLSNNLKGGYHINCSLGYVGRGRVRVVTPGLNLPRHGAETARSKAGRTQSGMLAETAGRSIKRTVQPRK